MVENGSRIKRTKSKSIIMKDIFEIRSMYTNFGNDIKLIRICSTLN